LLQILFPKTASDSFRKKFKHYALHYPLGLHFYLYGVALRLYLLLLLSEKSSKGAEPRFEPGIKATYLEVSKGANNFATPQKEYLCHVQHDVVYSFTSLLASSFLYLRHFAYHGIRKDCPELEFVKNLWGLGTEEE
jgi:hypothetical protein